MCGICGFAGRGNIQDLRLMTAALVHRGPDDEGLWHDRSKAVYLGHRRLSIGQRLFIWGTGGCLS